MQGLERELAEAKAALQTKSVNHSNLQLAIGLVCNDLQVEQPEGMSSQVAHAIQITEQVRALERDAFHADINWSFAIACSHYEDSINLKVMSLG